MSKSDADELRASRRALRDSRLARERGDVAAPTPTRLWGTVLPDRPVNSGPLFGPFLPARPGKPRRPGERPLPVGAKSAKPETEIEKLRRERRERRTGVRPPTLNELALQIELS